MHSSLFVFAAVSIFGGCIAAPSPPGTFQYYNLTTPLSGPCDITTGPDGAIWADTFLANKIARIDIKTGKLTEYDIPYTLPILNNTVLPSTLQGRVALACVIQPGKDGNLYAATGVRNQFVRINPHTKKVKVFDTQSPLGPLGNLQPFNDAWPGKTGMFFSQTTANVITLFDYRLETFKNFPIPTPVSGPLGIIIPADGGVWFTEFLASKIARLNATTGQIDEYPLPLTLLGPGVMRAMTGNGRYIWFVATISNALGRFDTVTKTVEAFPITLEGGDGVPLEDTNDGEGNIWYATAAQNNLNKFNPTTGEFTTYPQPESITTFPVGLPPAANIAVHWEKSDNSIWFSELARNRIGRFQLAGAPSPPPYYGGGR